MTPARVGWNDDIRNGSCTCACPTLERVRSELRVNHSRAGHARMDDRFNTIAGWVLGAGIVGLGLAIVSSHYFEADKHERPETKGYAIEGVAEGDGAEKEVTLDTLLPDAGPAKGQ